MSTLRQRLKEAKELLSKTYDTTITYVVVCKPTDTYENAIEIFDTIEEARECIKGINEQFVLDGGTRTKLYILPIVVDTDSYELVTEENMQYYDKNSEWVKDFKKERESWFNNLKIMTQEVQVILTLEVDVTQSKQDIENFIKELINNHTFYSSTYNKMIYDFHHKFEIKEEAEIYNNK